MRDEVQNPAEKRKGIQRGLNCSSWTEPVVKTSRADSIPASWNLEYHSRVLLHECGCTEACAGFPHGALAKVGDE